MTSTDNKSNFWSILLLVIVVPLLVTVIGGLAVEYLKPREVYTGNQLAASNVNTSPVSSVPVPPPSVESRAEQLTKLLTRKWYISQSPTVHGDKEVEFTDTGQIIRTYFRTIIGDSVTNHTFRVKETGELESDPALNLKLVKLSKDELVLSWDGTIAHYKRGWAWWEITMIGAVCVLVVLICIAAKNYKS